MRNGKRVFPVSDRFLCLVITGFVAVIVCGCSRPSSARERLIRAVDKGDYPTVEQILKHCPGLVNTEITEGELKWFPESVLTASVKLKHTRIAELLIRNGADVNYRDWGHLTALHYAAERGDTRVMDLLLAGGANPNASDDHGLTPMILAVEGGHRDAIKMLKRAHALPGSKIHEAAALGNLDGVREEVGRDPLVISSQQNYESPLSVGAANGRLKIVDFLMKNGADVDAQAFRAAARSGDASIVKLLRAKVTDLDAKGGESTQYTALQVAAMLGHNSVVEYLLSEGADPAVKTQGFTTVELARRAGHNDIAAMLLHQRPSK